MPPVLAVAQGAAGPKTREKPEASAVALIEIGAELELFHDGREGAYAMRPLPGGGRRAVPLKELKPWLAREYHLRSERKKAASAEALESALGVLKASALEGEQIDVHVRVAELGGAIYIDLADKTGRAVEIDATGWRIVDQAPVRFRLTRGMTPLPEPHPVGVVDELRGLINAPGDDEWRLILAWLVAALRPGRPMPLLVLQGEAGSAKSTTARLLRALVDPSAAPLRRPPREARDLAIAARNAWVLAFDNLSGLSTEMSDLLCCVATGGGFATRQLHTDSDEALFDFRRPVIINGIDEIATRGDLADRSLRITLPVIPEDGRRDEDDLTAAFEAARPRILGALYHAVSGALGSLAEARARLGRRLPRMADFAQWATAAEVGLQLPTGAAIEAYTRNRGELVEQSLEADAVAVAVRRLLERCDGGSWTGTMGELLDALKVYTTDPAPRGWPKHARALTDRFRRLAPHLRAVGVSLGPRLPRTNRGQIYDLAKAPDRRRDRHDRHDRHFQREAESDGRLELDLPTVTTVTRLTDANTDFDSTRDGRDGRDGDFAVAPPPPEEENP